MCKRCSDVFEAAVAHNSAPCSDPAASSEALRPKLLAALSGTVPACSTVWEFIRLKGSVELKAFG